MNLPRLAVLVVGLITVAHSSRSPAVAQSIPLPGAPETGSYVEMTALLEKTIFKVDVLTLTVRLFGSRADEVRRLTAARSFSNALADSIAQVAIRSQNAWAEIVFKRGVSLGQFLNGIDDNMRKAANAGIITRGDYDMLSAGLPRWFAFLESSGIDKGDRILYVIRGDSLRTQYWTVDGEMLLNQVDVGPERRLAVLGSYFVRKSNFRKDLLKSLYQTR